MKKIFVSVFGLALLAGSVVTQSDASRDAYQNYLYQKARTTQTRMVSPYPLRTFAEQKGTTRQLLQRDFTSNRRGGRLVRNLRYSQADTRNTFSQPGSSQEEAKLKLPLRPTTDRIALPWQERLIQTGKITLKNVNDAVETFETYENNTFSLQIPEGWVPMASEPHFFHSRLEDFTISIVKLEDPCQNVSFTTCAIALSTDRNHQNPAEKIINVTSIARQAQFSDTILNTPEIQTRTFTESFAGQKGSETRYISRHFVSGTDGGVYLIETQTSLRNAPRFIGVSKKIFDSFRILPAKAE
ncbi:hypothetical protein K9L27_02350 [Candidatus Gracilibacteria bacterium]|nr:hypothetical protein [Candidatus Gracilibacteria bacterium]